MSLLTTLIFLGALLPGLAAAQAAPSPDQFAWHQLILTQGGEAIFRFELPASAYSGSLRADLGDVRLFNGAGEALPLALVRREAPAVLETQSFALPHFPLRVSSRNEGRMELDVRRRGDGSLIAFRLAPSGQAARLSGYVLDASGLNKPMSALVLDWEPGAEGTVSTVALEASDDLQSWRSLNPRAQLVDLSLGQTHLRHKRIELPGLSAKYLRLLWGADQEALPLQRVAAEVVARHAPPEPLQWSSTVVRAGSQPGEYLFESSGLPVHTVRLALPQANTLAPLKLFRRAGEKEAWREVANTVAYRLQKQGREAASPDILLPRSRDRFWRLQVMQQGGGLGAGLPGIELGWVAQQAVFVARGAPPYTLAYGNAAVAPAEFDIATLVPGYQAEKFPDLPWAKAGPASANPNAPSPGMPDIHWRTLALWSVLVAGVALLGAMAWRLMKQMGRKQD